MSETYDAIIVGARCAGSPLAMLLSQKGHRVLLLDKATFPSNMPMSTHLVQPPALASLQRWGLLDRVAGSGCPRIETYLFDFGPFAIEGSPEPIDGIAYAFGPRRFVLDDILVHAAVDAGAELREDFRVDSLLWDSDRVVGIEGRAGSGGKIQERARIVIGADGMNSIVARSVKAPKYSERARMEAAVFSYWSGAQIEKFEVHIRDARSAFAIPTNDGRTLVASAWAARDIDSIRQDIESNYLSTMRAVDSDFYDRVQVGRREEKFIVGSVDNYFRKPYGPGWALAGDAGYLKDPVTASGITDAFRDAEMLSAAIDSGLSGQTPLEEALARHETERNEHAMAMFDFTCQLAALDVPPPEMQQLLSAVSKSPKSTSQFLGVFAQTVPVQAFFAPDNIGQVMAAAQGA